jgi:RNA polymerase sigma factor (sigma-70 family)
MENHLGRQSGGSGTEVLLDRAARGERSALGRVVTDYDPLLRKEVRRLLNARLFEAHGEDVEQIVRLAIVRGLPGLRLKNRAALAAWIRIVTRRKVIDWAKARRNRGRIPSQQMIRLGGSRSPELPAVSPTPSGILLRKEEKELLLEAIEAVPERYREVLRLLYEIFPTPDELAASFERKTSEAARKFVARALDHLEQVLRKRLEPPDGREP